MMAPRVLALDLDGTLVCHTTSKLPAAHERLVRMVRQRSIQVVLVTGRSHMTTVPVWRQLGLDTPMVCFNGAWVGFADRRCIARFNLSPRDVRDIIEVLRPFPGSMNAYPDIKTWIMHQICPTTADWASLYNADIKVIPEAFDNWNSESPKILYGCDAAIVDSVIRRLRRVFGQRFAIVKSQHDRFEILPHVNKATGLAALAGHMHIPPDEIWAVGDADNDLEMMAWPGRTFAMGHAPLAVRNAADHVLPGIEARGLSALLPYLERCRHDAAGSGR